MFTAFEVLEPVFSLGPIGVTTSELAVVFFIITIAAGVVTDTGKFFRHRPLDLAVVLFLATNLLSTLFADDRPSAFKFTLRLTYAAIIYFGVSRLPSRYRPHLVVAGAIAATAVLVSLIGLFENFYSSNLLSPFKERLITFGAYYNVRISSTLPFPTILAFYLELLTPVALVFGLWLAGREKQGRKRKMLYVLLLVCLTVILAAIAYTYTRSAYVIAPVSLLAGAVAAAIFGYGRRVWSLFLLSAAIFISLVGISALFSNTMAFRLGLAEQDQRYNAEYTLVDIPESFLPGERISSTIHIKNLGSVLWDDSPDDRTLMIYRWLSYPELAKQDVELLIASVPRDIPTGGEADIKVDVITPLEPGKYILVYELFIDAPFSHTGVEPLAVPVELKEAGSSYFAITEQASAFFDRDPAPMSIPRRQLWRAAIEAWKENPVAGLGPDQFRKRYTEFLPDVELDPRLGAHNIILDAMANTGAIGVVALVYLLVTAVWILLKRVSDRTAANDLRLISLGVLISMAAYIGHGMFEYPLWQTGMLFMLFVLMGLISLLKVEKQ